MKINVRFEEETYVAKMSADDFNYTKNYYPHRTISIRGFGEIELNVPIKYLILEAENSNESSAYCQKGFFKKDTK